MSISEGMLDKAREVASDKIKAAGIVGTLIAEIGMLTGKINEVDLILNFLGEPAFESKKRGRQYHPGDALPITKGSTLTARVYRWNEIKDQPMFGSDIQNGNILYVIGVPQNNEVNKRPENSQIYSDLSSLAKYIHTYKNIRANVISFTSSEDETLATISSFLRFSNLGIRTIKLSAENAPERNLLLLTLK